MKRGGREGERKKKRREGGRRGGVAPLGVLALGYETPYSILNLNSQFLFWAQEHKTFQILSSFKEPPKAEAQRPLKP